MMCAAQACLSQARPQLRAHSFGKTRQRAGEFFIILGGQSRAMMVSEVVMRFCVPTFSTHRSYQAVRPSSCWQRPLVISKWLTEKRLMPASNASPNCDDCRILEVIPRMVAMASSPNISNMPGATKTTFAPSATATAVSGPYAAAEAEGEKSSNPIFIRMMPPTIRTMLRGTLSGSAGT
jgi:hypothetical protein